MKKLLLLIALMIGFMSFSPVENGDQLKTSPVVEEMEQMDLLIENQTPIMLTTYNIPLEPGYTVSAPLAGNYVTSIQEGAILNYCTNMSDDITENRYRQEHDKYVYTYNNLGYPIDKNDNFVRWLIYCPERYSLL